VIAQVVVNPITIRSRPQWPLERWGYCFSCLFKKTLSRD